MRKVTYPISVACALLAILVLAACGSSGSSTSSTAAATTAPAASSGSSAGGQSNGATATVNPSAATALVDCLKKQGVHTSEIKPGEVPSPPSGVSVQKFHEALLHCGVPTVGAPVTPTAPNKVPLFEGRYTGPHLHAALSAFTACMRARGVSVPQTPATGAIPATPGSGVNEQKLIAAERICFPLITKELKLKIKRPFHTGHESPPTVAGT